MNFLKRYGPLIVGVCILVVGVFIYATPDYSLVAAGARRPAAPVWGVFIADLGDALPFVGVAWISLCIGYLAGRRSARTRRDGATTSHARVVAD
jgi:hypothetical protein